jgi:uncharacterized protein YmfQ (DUF2313 family)
MGLMAADYLGQLLALLPPGPAWPREPDALPVRLLAGLSEEFARVDAGADQILTESDPRTVYDLLPDWERIANITPPDGSTIEQRRAALTAKLTGRGGQSRAYFIALAARLGFDGVTITEYQQMNCNGDCNDLLYSQADAFVWMLNIPAAGGMYSGNCNSPCDSPLGSWGYAALEAEINEDKPAHTTALFNYV